MRWLVFAVFAYLALALNDGAAALLYVPTRLGPITPDFVLMLAAFIALWASPSVAMWACLVLGLLVDLMKPVSAVRGNDVVTFAVLGPATLGYLFAGYVMVRLRAVLNRASPLAVSVMSFAAGIFVHLTIVAMLALRNAPWFLNQHLAGWDDADQLIFRFLSMLYTAAAAIPVGWVLTRLQPFWGFESPRSGFLPRRG
ncbi:MAG: hypothetical protein K8S99_17570 [Planctomycetes bacterium]|nr:hypothetical protein [Planctomycetota bacterium]